MSVAIRSLESDNRNLIEEMKELRKKVDLLTDWVSQCPTCGTSLAEAGIEHVRSALNSEGEQRRRKYDENRRRITEMTAERDKVEDGHTESASRGGEGAEGPAGSGCGPGKGRQGGGGGSGSASALTRRESCGIGAPGRGRFQSGGAGASSLR